MKERKPASTMTGLPARRVNAPARRLTPQVQARLAPQVQAPAIQTPVPAVSVVVRGNAILTGVARLCTMGRAHDQHMTTAQKLLRLSMQVNAQYRPPTQPSAAAAVVPTVSVVILGNAILTGVARLCTMGRAHDQHITTAHMLLRLSMQVNAQNQHQLQPLNQVHEPQRLQQRLLHHLLRPRRARGTAKP